MHDHNKIWPGPECLYTETDLIGALVYQGRLAGARTLACKFAVRRKYAECCAQGLALASIKARARMGRFLVWLGRWRGPWADDLRAKAAVTMSPEQCVREADPWHVRGFAFNCDAVSVQRFARISHAVRDGAAASEIDAWLASPEWAALPWQRDPSGGVA